MSSSKNCPDPENDIVSSPELSSLGICHGTTASCWGDMKNPLNQSVFFRNTGLPAERILFLHQVHADQILAVDCKKDFDRFSASPRHKADAWTLSLKNCTVAIQTADCAPVFIWDKNASVVALAHCGWRGTIAGLPEKLAKAVMLNPKAKPPFSAWIGPHIGECCFEIKKDVAGLMKHTATRENKIYGQLALEIMGKLKTAGIPADNINVFSGCTCCSGNRFLSFRRTGSHDSMLSFISTDGKAD